MNQAKKEKPNSNTPLINKEYVSIYWKCCHAFSRIYKNKLGTAYTGVCPKCRAPLTLPIGKEGTTQRIFIAE